MPDLARPRRDARGRRRRGGRALPARRRARSRCPRAARDVRRAHARCSACAGASRTCSPALGLAETYTPSLRADDPDPDALTPARADLGRARGPAHDACCRASSTRRAATSSSAPSDDRALRDRARLPARPATSRTSTSASPGIVEGGFARAKGIVEALYAALKAEPAFERGERPAAPSRARRPASRPGVVGELHPGAARGRLGRVRARPRDAPRRRRASPSATRT